MSTKFRILCGVPVNSCIGSSYVTDQTLSKKAHASREDAFRCMKKHLVSEGYEQIGPREFRPPGGGPILVLNKKSKFGGMLRTGKAGEGGGLTSSRFMPKDRGQGIVF